jgi:hypothetical protein
MSMAMRMGELSVPGGEKKRDGKNPLFWVND